jgi:anti-sigma B factor antagonist
VNNHDPQSCFLVPWTVVTGGAQPEPLEIEGRFVGAKSGDVWIVRAVGVIDVNTASKLEKTIKGMCDAEALSMIVNVEDVAHVDSVGFGLLANVSRRLRSEGLSLSLVGPSAFVRRTLHDAGLDATIQCFGTDEQVLDHMNRIGAHTARIAESPNPGEPLPKPKPEDDPSPTPHPNPPIKPPWRASNAIE